MIPRVTRIYKVYVTYIPGIYNIYTRYIYDKSTFDVMPFRFEGDSGFYTRQLSLQTAAAVFIAEVKTASVVTEVVLGLIWSVPTYHAYCCIYVRLKLSYACKRPLNPNPHSKPAPVTAAVIIKAKRKDTAAVVALLR